MPGHILLPLAICSTAIPLVWLSGALRPQSAGPLAVAVATAATTALAWLISTPPEPLSISWMSQWDVALTFQLDGLAAAYGLLAAGVGVLVMSYAVAYMPHHLDTQGRQSRELASFFSLMTLFMAAMLGLVTSGDLLQLFVFWEVTTICSYLLIAFDRHEGEARRSALMALIVTGSAGILLLVAALLLSSRYGTTAIGRLVDLAEPDGMTTTAAALLVIAATAKSAQWPLHFWLPRAMVAPTPVSAYLHAAAMVAAGVFLLHRIQPLLQLQPWLAGAVAAVGWISMIAGGLAALREDEMKRILAYSTIAQYGHAVFLIGMGATGAAAFFVLAHGICKSALFLSAGAVTSLTGEKKLSSLGGLGKSLPLLATATAVAAAGLAGVPLTVGFFKDELLFASVEHRAPWVVLLALLGPALTVAYMWRFWTGVFGGRHGVTAAPAPRLLVWPVATAAAVAAAAGVWPGPVTALAEWAGAAELETAYHFDLRASNLAALAAFGLAAILVAARATVTVPTAAVAGAHDVAERTYRTGIAVLRGLGAWARTGARQLRSGIALVVLAAAALVSGGQACTGLSPVELRGTWSDAPLAAALVLTSAAAILTVTTRRHLTLIILLSVTSLAAAGLFALAGAPDVALVMVIINVVTTLLLLALLHRLPRAAIRRQERARPLVRWPGENGVVAGASAAMAFLVAWGVLSQPRPGVWLGAAHLALAEAAHAGNVVTAILVDFRGLDTLGEITVIVISVLAVERLLLRHEAEEERPGP
jgi:multicomponent Na+:H+ antiporter subunit A